MDERSYWQIIESTANDHDLEHNTVCLIEECAELQQQLSKVIRMKPDKQHLTEEIADVIITIDIMRHTLGIKKEKTQALAIPNEVDASTNCKSLIKMLSKLQFLMAQTFNKEINDIDTNDISLYMKISKDLIETLKGKMNITEEDVENIIEQKIQRYLERKKKEENN